MSNTRYQPAPQRDSFEEQHYTQAPPSYQTQTGPSDGLLGAPRGEDDNVPDDFKVREEKNPLSRLRTMMMLTSLSSAAQSQRPLWTFVCNSSAKSTQSCTFPTIPILFTSHLAQLLTNNDIGPSNSSSQPSPRRSPSSPPPTATGSKPTPG
jgi:hypothetical protein